MLSKQAIPFSARPTDIGEKLVPADGNAVGVEAASSQLHELTKSLQELQDALEDQNLKMLALKNLMSDVSAGMPLENVLENIYVGFRRFIPYNRIGLSLIESGGQMVRAIWVKSDQAVVKIPMGYTALLEGSSLQTVLSTGQPRIINNLPDYLAKKPASLSTRLIVEEGIRSSLTCPLIANGKPIGFIFFSSKDPYVYDNTHVDIFSMIACQLSMIIEKAVILKQNQNLQRLNERKNYYLDMAAHDIRSPIAQIQMAAQTSQEFFDVMSEEERTTFAATIIKQSNAVLGLLDNILDMGQIETGQLRLHPEPVLVKDFMEEIVKNQTPIAATKEIHVLLGDVPQGDVVVDRLRLRQVMDNLTSNAIKFSPRGSTIAICVLRRDGVWRISIQDSGPGLSVKDRERVFQEYGKLSAKPTGGEKSIGLGLVIVRHLVEAHGGHVGVDSVFGHGATFWFTLPA